MKAIFSKQTGDTIIEVMIAIVVMSGVLGAAFAISNKSSITTQANHERYQAQMYANQQAEWIKSYATDNSAALLGYTEGANFCMTDNGGSLSLVRADESACKKGIYQITINPQQMQKIIGGTGDPVTNTFYIKVSWDSLTNKNGQDQVELVYGL